LKKAAKQVFYGLLSMDWGGLFAILKKVGVWLIRSAEAEPDKEKKQPHKNR